MAETERGKKRAMLEEALRKAKLAKNKEQIARAQGHLDKHYPNALRKDVTVVKGKPDIRNTREVLDQPSGSAFRKKIAKMTSKGAKAFAGKALKSIPLIGGALAAFQSGDASAAIPILGDVEGAGGGKDAMEFERRRLREHAEWERKRKRRGK